MNIQQIRNATLKITYHSKTFLLDPWLCGKGETGSFSDIPGQPFIIPDPVKMQIAMPIFPLPMDVRDVLDGVDYYVVTHLHPDHIDIVADGTVGAPLDRSVPVFTQHEGDAALKQYLPQMQKEYAYWMDGVENLQAGQQEKRVVKLQDGTLLNRYWDDNDTPRPESWLDDVKTAKSNPNRPATEIYRDLRSAAASGWDFSSRWMDNPQQLATIRTTSIVPVDLNALMFHLEKTLARASKAAGDSAGATRYDALANARQQAIEKYLWNEKEGWYADYDLKTHKVRNQLTAAALFPLYVNAAAKDRANKMATATKTHLLQPGGLNTTSVKSGQQWDAPNGWAPLQWVATEGLQNYGQKEVAMDISWHFLTNVQHTYDREKKLVEKYDVSTTGTGGGGGEYPLQDGFGWTNGVTLKMLDLICPKEQPCDNVPATRPLSESTTQPVKQNEAEPTP